MAQLSGRWICNLEVLGSNPLPCHMDLRLIILELTPPRFVNSQLVSPPPVARFVTNFSSVYNIWLLVSLCKTRKAVLNTFFTLYSLLYYMYN